MKQKKYIRVTVDFRCAACNATIYSYTGTKGQTAKVLKDKRLNIVVEHHQCSIIGQTEGVPHDPSL